MKSINDKILESHTNNYIQVNYIYNFVFDNYNLNSMGARFDKLDEIFKYCYIFIDYQTVSDIISKIKSMVKSSEKYSDDDKKYINKNLGIFLKNLKSKY